MFRKKHWIRSLIDFLRRENLDRILILLTVLILVSAGILSVTEPDLSLLNALWLSIVTLTTVGYGDITPATVVGRIVGVVIMLFGIGILGMFTASIASIFVERKMRENRGMHSFDFKDHLIICTWNQGAGEIIKELRTDHRFRNRPVVLISDIEEKPVDDEDLFFVKGKVNEETLNRANLAKAATVIILGDDQLEPNARDAKVVLSALAVESINPEAYSIVELAEEANVRHCQRAQADEIIVSSEFSCRLVSRAALDHGISKVVSDLLSAGSGDDIYKIPVPEGMAGKPFIEIFTRLKQEEDSIVLAIQKAREEVISNPPGTLTVDAEDALIVIKKSEKQNGN